ncbi:hypothetical protein [Dinoroseobacter sp. S76]
MTLFEFIIPVLALALAAGGAFVLRRERRKLDTQLARQHAAE